MDQLQQQKKRQSEEATKIKRANIKTANIVTGEVCLLEDSKESRALYEEAFEDSIDFVDFYYEKLAKNNRILVIRDRETDEVISMLHLVPKRLHGTGNVLYIYAVATKHEKKRQGLMQRLMQKALEIAHAEGYPLVYLVPVNPDVYKKFGFFPFGSKGKKTENQKSDDGVIIDHISQELVEKLQQQFKTCVEADFDEYLVHDAQYYKEALEALFVDGGKVKLYEQGGYEFFYGDKSAEWVRKGMECTPYGLARITKIESCQFDETTLPDGTYQIQDAWLPNQNGIYAVTGGKARKYTKSITPEGLAVATPVLTVEQLGELLQAKKVYLADEI